MSNDENLMSNELIWRRSLAVRIAANRFPRTRAAFTLVEMLVAVAIVVVMMTLFATIFQMATGAMGKQRGIGENDQRVRLVAEMLRNDLGSTPKDPVTGTNSRRYRTFRVLIPWAANESAAPINPLTGTAAAAADRSGYFMISEGNPLDDTDDSIQLTVNVPTTSNDRIFGRAAALLTDAAGQYGPGNNSSATGPYWGNQPAFDAVFAVPPLYAGSSTTAEVSYFLRNGTLYRRVMLVRMPNVSGVTDPTPMDSNTATTTPVGPAALILTPYTTKSFYSDFDYSAFFSGTGLTFHGLSDLTAAGGVASTFLNPATRWGFDDTSTPGAGSSYGLPREYVAGSYIGRFTHRETSDSNFLYPGIATNNPISTATATIGYNTTTGVVQFGGTDAKGPRAGEDVIMSNVLAFDIKVWDPAASVGPDGQPGFAGVDDDGLNGIDDPGELGFYGSDDGDWVNIGHAGFNFKNAGVFYGFYRAAACLNSYYSNSAATPPTNRYDTWGDQVEIDGNAAAKDPPPYRPVYAGPDGKPGVAGVDDDVSGTVDDASELGWPGSDDFAPLTAIKITIRFYDVSSNQVRDMTCVYRLIYEQ